MIDKLSPNDAKWVAKAREDGKEIAALRARVAKLEGALNDVARFSIDLGAFVRAALKDAPQ